MARRKHTSGKRSQASKSKSSNGKIAPLKPGMKIKPRAKIRSVEVRVRPGAKGKRVEVFLKPRTAKGARRPMLVKPAPRTPERVTTIDEAQDLSVIEMRPDSPPAPRADAPPIERVPADVAPAVTVVPSMVQVPPPPPPPGPAFVPPDTPTWQEASEATKVDELPGPSYGMRGNATPINRSFDWNKPIEDSVKAETIASPRAHRSNNDPPMMMKAPPELTERPIDSASPVGPEEMQDESAPQALLFECAWEVCWQLGGIYTVLKTKAVSMLQRWHDRYCLIGPYNPKTAAIEFEERPAEGVIGEALARLQNAGIPAKFGRWLIPGRPNTILIDYRAKFWTLDTDKYLMWADHHISTPANDGEMNEVIAFGFAVTEFFNQLVQVAGSRPIVAHFHEWMGGVAVPRIAHLRIPVQTVFTTHATLLGRYLASDSPEFYNHLPFIDPDREANKYQIYPRFAIERAAAHASTVFTTVSDVTGVEAEKLLGRKPDLILPNGLNIQRFSALHEFQNLHREYKEQIHEFVMGHFFPAYSFDLDRTIYFVTSGRYEYRNKGMDLFIEAMARLNWRMKHMPDPPTVVAFIITRAPTRSINVGVLQSRSMFDDLRASCEDLAAVMGQHLFESAAHGRMPTLKDLIDEDSLVRLKKSIHAWRNGRQPPIVTHDLHDDASDPTLVHLRHRHLFNGADDPVKVVFHPDFLSTTNPLIGLDYDQFVRGTHMGIFPSYYEPWGYTPMECTALGVPTVTTDLAGFGGYVQREIQHHEEQGVVVLNRRSRSFDESTNDLVDYLYRFVQMSRRQRIEQRNRVERLSEMFDWSELVRHYHAAHNLSLERGQHAIPEGQLEVRVV